MDESTINDLARYLHETMERLDPTQEPEWADLSSWQKEFYRVSVRAILLRLSEITKT